MRSADIHTRIFTIALFAVLACLLFAGRAEAAEWQHCPTADMAGLLKVKVAGCPEGRAVVERYAEKAQSRGPRIRVFGFRCHAVGGSSPIKCQRGHKRIEYVGTF